LRFDFQSFKLHSIFKYGDFIHGERKITFEGERVNAFFAFFFIFFTRLRGGIGVKFGLAFSIARTRDFRRFPAKERSGIIRG
jgi:hypothetical protein